MESEWNKLVARVAFQGLSCTLPLLGSFSPAQSPVGELLSSATHLGHDVLFHHGAETYSQELWTKLIIMNLFS